MADVSEIRRILQVYDNTSMVGGRQAVGMLAGITKQIAAAPAKFDLNIDPSERLFFWQRMGAHISLAFLQATAAVVLAHQHPTSPLRAPHSPPPHLQPIHKATRRAGALQGASPSAKTSTSPCGCQRAGWRCWAATALRAPGLTRTSWQSSRRTWQVGAGGGCTLRAVCFLACVLCAFVLCATCSVCQGGLAAICSSHQPPPPKPPTPNHPHLYSVVQGADR